MPLPQPRPDDSYELTVRYKVDEEDLVALRNRLRSYAKCFKELDEEGMAHCCNEDADFIQGWYLDYNPDGTYREKQGEDA